MAKVNHELDSNNADGFRKYNSLAERMKKKAAGEYVEPKRPKKIIEHTPGVISDNTISQEDDCEENTVTIENKNINFEVSYPYDTKLMAVGLKAMSIDTSEDSVSILMRDTVQLKLPKLVPLHLTVDGQPYKVCWAGGSHNFGKFKHISFVVVE